MQTVPPRLLFPILIGDIGGTNARFAIIDSPDSAIDRIPDLKGREYETSHDAIAEAIRRRGGTAPRTAILALAGPIEGDRVDLTNSHWVIEPVEMIRRQGFDEVVLLNDFEALSLCLPGLGPNDIEPIGGGVAEPTGARLVVGPGTGLGAGALVHANGLWVPVPSEGGHMDFGPKSERDFAIWPHIVDPDGRVSGESLISGSGLVRLYRAVTAVDGIEPGYSEPREITENGMNGGDPFAEETLQLFAEYLGRFAGDLALAFKATGGVYLAGGVTARVASVLKTGRFREAFNGKTPQVDLMEGMMTAMITATDPALAGISAFAREPHRFGVALEGRHWRR